jgi:peptidoglycan/LPS O-acetylase OafA/YrhL
MLVHAPTRDFVELTREDGKLRHVTSLDGLRGLAVGGVLLFHLGLPFMVGGYLGVSTFFTLSGFLITSLLLNELQRNGAVDVRGFWSRRGRRLLAASLATIALVTVVFGHRVATADQRAAMRGDALSATFQVANWHYVLQGQSYSRLFVSPSPLLHFWSLAVEEQFYWILPLVLLGLWRLVKGRHRLLGAALAVLSLCSALEPFVFNMSDDRIYFGTDTRAVEILVGGVLAVVLSERTVRRRLALRLKYRAAVVLGATVVLLVQLWWWLTLDQSAGWLYRGGFALYALMTCVVITAAMLPAGPVRHLLDTRLLRYLGERSFGLYLVHWPVFLAVRQTWPTMWTPLRVVLSLGISLGIAEASFRFLEQPVRTGRWPRPGQGPKVAAAAMAGAVLLALLPLPADASQRTVDFEQSAKDFAKLGDSSRPTTTTQPADSNGKRSPRTTVPTAPVPRVSLFGDSTGLLVGLGLAEYGRAHPDELTIAGGAADLGCGVARYARIRAITEGPPIAKCSQWATNWAAELDRSDPDVALLVTGAWEVPDVIVRGTGKWSSILDPATAAYATKELTEAVDLLSSRGALVVLMTWPEFGAWSTVGQSVAVQRQRDPARMAKWHQIEQMVAASRPGKVEVIDLAAWLGPRSQDQTLRPDGIHIPAVTIQNELAPKYLAPQLDKLWQQYWKANQSTTTTLPPTTTTTVRTQGGQTNKQGGQTNKQGG